MKQKLFIIITVLILSSCISTKTSVLNNDDIEVFRGAKIAQVVRETANFDANTSKNQLLYGGDPLEAMIRGNSLIRQYGVQDPAIEIGEEITKFLKNKYVMTASLEGYLDSKTTKVDKIANSVSPDVALIVDVQTASWFCHYLPLKWNHYEVYYRVKLRIISNRSKKVLAEGYFDWHSPKDFPHPTYKGLIANNAKILKHLLSLAKRDAIEYFIKEVIKP